MNARVETVGPTTLVLGDCLDAMVGMAPASIDMIAADLPYGMTSNRWDSVIPFEPLWAAFLRVCKPTAAIVLTASQPFTSALVMSRPDLFRHEWVWAKNRGSNFANTAREPMKEHESVLVFSRGGWTFNRQMQPRAAGGRDRVKYGVDIKTASSNYRAFGREGHRLLGESRVPSSVQEFNTEVGLHPTQKPLALFSYLVRTYSNPGDTVLDCCMGSGTTGHACIVEGRRFVGIEIDPAHYATTHRRVEVAARQADLFRTLPAPMTAPDATCQHPAPLADLFARTSGSDARGAVA